MHDCNKQRAIRFSSQPVRGLSRLLAQHRSIFPRAILNVSRVQLLYRTYFMGQGKADRPDSGGVLPRRWPRGAGAGADTPPEDAGQAPAEGGDDVRPSQSGHLEVPPRAEVSAAGDVFGLMRIVGFVGLFVVGPSWRNTVLWMSLTPVCRVSCGVRFLSSRSKLWSIPTMF